MTTLAKAITLIIILKGIVNLLYPTGYKKISLSFAQRSSIVKRIYGIIVFLLGFLLIYSTRIYLVVPSVHWIIAVSGILLIISGFITALLPNKMSDLWVWFYKDKTFNSIVGIIFIVGGIILYASI